MKHLGSIFECNNYPFIITKQCIERFFNKLYVPKQIIPIALKREFVVVLVGNFSLDLRKPFYKSISKSFSQYNIKGIFQSKN